MTAARLTTEIDEELAWVLLRLSSSPSITRLNWVTVRRRQLQSASRWPRTQSVSWVQPSDTLNSRNSLAAAYLAAGRSAEAIPLFEQILAVRHRTLGPDDPETLISQNNLATAYQDAGRTAEAIRLYELNLEIRERLLGPDHPSTLNSRGNLAAAYRDGAGAEAIPPSSRPAD
jgi:tetratricopeptide (TPR) repeat protein